MRTKLSFALTAAMCLLSAGTVHAQTPLTTAFTYQGELAAAGSPATGTYDIRFRLFDAASGGNQIGGTLCSDNLAVSAGRFGASLDFGGVFTGQKRFLEIEVRQDAGLDCLDASGYTVLSPRQELTATPNATFALTATNASSAATLGGQPAAYFSNAANLTGTVPSAGLSGSYSNALTLNNVANVLAGNGGAITGINAANVNTGTLAEAQLPTAVARTNTANSFGPLTNTFAGPVGIGTLSPSRFLDVVSYLSNGTAPAIDQQQTVNNGGFSIGLDLWQSFTPAISGQLAQVDINGASGISGQSRSVTVRIYAGEGTGGALLATNTMTLFDVGSGGWSTTGIPGQTVVVAGQQYTIRISGAGAAFPISGATGNLYSGGRNDAGATRDYMFRTYVASATSSSMFNVGLGGVGINNANPIQTLDVDGRLRLARGVIQNGSTPVTATTDLGFYSQGATQWIRMVTNNGAFQWFTEPGPDGVGVTPRMTLNAGGLNTTGPITASAFTGSGGGLTGLNASNLSAGTVPEGVLSGNIPRLNVNNTFAGDTQTFNGRIRMINGVITDGSNTVGTTDLGLYSQRNGFWQRYVTSGGGGYSWYTDGLTTPAGGAARMQLTTAGLSVVGSLSKGGGSFKIDHPLDPENKYLYHSFVESPDMMNIYNGEVTTDGTGYATITLPDYFEALNRDFRYQLTVIDDDDQSDVVVWAKVVRRIGADGANTFTVRTFRPNVAVSWQVTGIRQDAWAQKNRIPNSVDKPAAEKGKLLHPEAFGKAAEQGISSTPAPALHGAESPVR